MRSIGKRYLIWTVGHHWAGRLVSEDHEGWTLDEVEIIAEAGDATRADLGKGTWEQAGLFPPGRRHKVLRGAALGITSIDDLEMS